MVSCFNPKACPISWIRVWINLYVLIVEFGKSEDIFVHKKEKSDLNKYLGVKDKAVKKNKLGRPKIYAEKKEAYTVYNKKKPPIRVTAEEKRIIEYLRKNPETLEILNIVIDD